MTKLQAVLKLMLDGEWHSHLELRAVGGTRFSARLHDIYKNESLEVEKRFKDGGWQYRYDEDVLNSSICCDCDMDDPLGEGHGKCKGCWENTGSVRRDLLDRIESI